MKPLLDILKRDDLGGFRNTVEMVCAQVDSLHSEQSIPMACDWRVAIENTLEYAHVPHVHKDTLDKLKLKSICAYRHGRHSFERFRITDSRSLRGLGALEHIFPATMFGEYFHLYLYPHTTISSVCGFTYSLQHYFPTGDSTVLLSRLYSSRVRAGFAAPGFFFDSAAKFNRQVFEEDARLCERIHLRDVKEPCPEPLQRLAWFTEAQHGI